MLCNLFCSIPSERPGRKGEHGKQQANWFNSWACGFHPGASHSPPHLGNWAPCAVSGDGGKDEIPDVLCQDKAQG